MDVYWTEERSKHLSRAYGAKGWPFHLIEDKFHPIGGAKIVLQAAYDEGREWANKRKRSDLHFINQQRLGKYMRSFRPLDAIEGWTHIGAAVRNIMSEIE